MEALSANDQNEVVPTTEKWPNGQVRLEHDTDTVNGAIQHRGVIHWNPGQDVGSLGLKEHPFRCAEYQK